MAAHDGKAGPADIVATSAAGPAAMRGGLLRSASFAGSLLFVAVSAPLLVRHLGDVEFGRYSTALALVAVVAGLTDGGVATVALRELATAAGPAERRRIMGDLLGLRLLLSVVGVALAIGIATVVGYDSQLTLGVLLAGVGMTLLTAQSLLVAMPQSQLRFGWVALIELARGLISVSFIVAVVLTGGGVVTLLATTIPAGALALALTLPVLGEHRGVRPTFAPARWGPLLRDVGVIAVAVAVYALYLRVMLIVTSIVSTPEQTGYFAISFRVMEALIAVPALLVGAAFPIIARSARDDRERFEYASGRIYELSLLLGGLATTILLLAAPFIVELLVGTSNHPSVAILRIQGIALLAGFVVAGTAYPLLGMRRHREILTVNVASLLLAIGFAFALAPAHGATGAAVAGVAADVALATACTVILMRRAGPSLPLSAVAVTLVAGGCGYAAGRSIDAHPLVQATVGAVVFLAVLAVTRRVPPELRELLTHRPPPGAG